MKQGKASNRFLLWIWYLLLGILWMLILYVISGDRIRLLPLDIQYKFAYNRRTLLLTLLICMINLILWVYGILRDKQMMCLKWYVKIGKIHFSFGECRWLREKVGIKTVITLFAIMAVIGIDFGMGKCIMRTEGEWAESKTVTHALGMIDGQDYTNSLEAFEWNYAQGNRVFEADFGLTSDNKLVLVHDWNQGFFEGVDKQNLPSEDAFKEAKVLGKYTTLTLTDLFEIMDSHEDIWIVTDTKSRKYDVEKNIFEVMYNTAAEMQKTYLLDRIVVQLYNDEMLDAVESVYDFPNIIYTMYLTWDGLQENFPPYCRFCVNNGIETIVMWNYLAEQHIVETADKFGIKVYAHTVNDLDEANRLMDNGVWGVYTDILTPDDF